MPDPVRQDAWKGLGKLCVHSAKFDSPQRQPFSQCLPGTRVQLLNNLRHTIHTESQKIIWLSGESGSGKSAVAHTLAQEFSNNKALAASFFFSRRHDIRSTTDRFIPTISYQLGLFHPRAKDKIVEALVNDPALLDADRSWEDQLFYLILAPLRALLNGWKQSAKKIIMLFDALDECEPGAGGNRLRQLVEFFLKALQSENTTNFHVVVTSRPYENIQDAMSRSNAVIRLSIENFNADRDIELFLQSSFDEMRRTPSLGISRAWPSKGHLRLLVKKISRRFIVATTVMRMMKQKNRSQLNEFLNALLQTQQINTIDELYLEVLRSSDDASEAASLAVLVLSLRQPLSITDISKLLSTDARPILDSIAAIISVPPIDSGEPVATYHTSIRDFFWDKTRSQDLYVDPATVHCRLACASLELMNFTLTTDICGFDDASLLHTEIEDFAAKRADAIPPALGYAAIHWLHHLCESSPDSKLYELLSLFTECHILHWIEVVSLTDGLNHSMASLFRPFERVKTFLSMPDQEDVVALLSDAYRLMNEFFDCISQSALHVYHTALPLCPTNTRLRKAYAQDLLDASTTVVEGLDEDWSPIVRVIEFRARVLCISFDGPLAAVDRRTRIEVWDIMAGVMFGSHVVLEHGYWNINGAFARNSSCLAYRFSSRAFAHARYDELDPSVVHVWTLSTNNVLSIDAAYARDYPVAVSSGGNLVAWPRSYAAESRLVVVANDQSSGELSLIFEKNMDHAVPFENIQLFFSPSDSWLVIYTNDAVSVFDCCTGDITWSLSPNFTATHGPGLPVICIAVTFDEQYIAFLRREGVFLSPLARGSAIDISGRIILDNPEFFAGESLPQYSIKSLERDIIEFDGAYHRCRETDAFYSHPIAKQIVSVIPFLRSSTCIEVIDPSLSSPPRSNAMTGFVNGCDDNTFAMTRLTVEEDTELWLHVRGPQGWKSPARLPSSQDTLRYFCSSDGTFHASFDRIEAVLSVYRTHPVEHIFSKTGPRWLGEHMACFSPKCSYLAALDEGLDEDTMTITVWKIPGGEEVSRISVGRSGMRWRSILQFIGEDTLRMTAVLDSPDEGGSVHWNVTETSLISPYPLRNYSSSCDLHFNLSRWEFWQSPHLDKVLILGYAWIAQDFVYIHLEGHGPPLRLDPDSLSQSGTFEPRRFEVTRKNPQGTVCDTHTWSSLRLYPDGWIWDGRRRVTWIPPQYRPKGEIFNSFVHDGSVVRKFGDGVLILSNKCESPLILNFRQFAP